MIELGLQLLNVGCFHRLQLFLCNGMLYGDGHKLVIVVVFDPPSDCQLCVRNFVLLDLLVFDCDRPPCAAGCVGCIRCT